MGSEPAGGCGDQGSCVSRLWSLTSVSQRFAADDSQRRCEAATGWRRAEINCLEGGQRERRERRCFPSSYQRFPSLAARCASTELERDVLCLQRDLHLSVPSLAVPGVQGLVAWHLDELVAASSHRRPDPRALSPAWPDLLACPCPPATRRGGGDDLPSPHTCVGKRLWSPQAALRGSLPSTCFCNSD